MVATRRKAAPRRALTVRAPQRPRGITNLQSAGAKPGRFNWWVYGGSGIGKSVLGGTAPKSLIMSTEIEGTESARVMGSTADKIEVPTWQEYLDTVRWLEHGGHKEFEWVVLDSMDSLEENAWNAIMGQSGAARSVGGSFRSKSRNDYPLVWSAMGEQVDRLVRLPTNVLILSKVMRVEVETDDDDVVPMALPLVGSTKRGDLSMSLCGKMSLVAYYRRVVNDETGKRSRRLYTSDVLVAVECVQSEQPHLARSRRPVDYLVLSTAHLVQTNVDERAVAVPDRDRVPTGVAVPTELELLDGLVGEAASIPQLAACAGVRSQLGAHHLHVLLGR